LYPRGDGNAAEMVAPEIVAAEYFGVGVAPAPRHSGPYVAGHLEFLCTQSFIGLI